MSKDQTMNSDRVRGAGLLLVEYITRELDSSRVWFSLSDKGLHVKSTYGALDVETVVSNLVIARTDDLSHLARIVSRQIKRQLNSSRVANENVEAIKAVISLLPVKEQVVLLQTIERGVLSSEKSRLEITHDMVNDLERGQKVRLLTKLALSLGIYKIDPYQ